jgi:hypothetical protein
MNPDAVTTIIISMAAIALFSLLPGCLDGPSEAKSAAEPAVR